MSESCEQYRNWIKDLLAGELDPDSTENLNRHLSECPGCRLEYRQLEQTVFALRGLEEDPVPHHFYVYQDEPALRRSWTSLQGWLQGWRLAGAAVSFAVVVLAVFVVAGTDVSLDGSSLRLSFGRPDPAAEFDPAALRADLLAAVQSAVREEIGQRDAALRGEIQQLASSLSQEQEAALRPALQQLEARLAQRMNQGDNQIRENLEAAFGRFSRNVLAQHQEDMRLVRLEMNRFAEFDRYQAGQATAIMARLSRITETRVDRGGSR